MVSCKARQEFSSTIRASPARPQNVWQSVIAPIWSATATTARLGAVGFWMDWQQKTFVCSFVKEKIKHQCYRLRTTRIEVGPAYELGGLPCTSN